MQLNGGYVQLNFSFKNCIFLFLQYRFPLFTAIHHICSGKLKPDQLIDCIRNHPEHM